ncbi:MAG: hypothetical protein J6S21_08075, partial [Victivallales bacterium]|nr:hypothetical protein [Victivallales bacterium]
MQKNQNNENEGAAGINNRTRKLIIAGAAAAAVIALLWLVICGITSGYRRLYRDNTAFLLKDVRIENCRDDKIRRSVNNTLEIHGIGIGTSTLPAIPVEKIRNMLLQDTRLSNAEVTR